MNLLRNVSDLSRRSSKLVKSLKRAEEFLFPLKEVEDGNFSPDEKQAPIPSFKALFQEEAQLLPSYLSKLHVDPHHPVMGIARDFYGQNPSMPSVLPSLQLRAMFVLLIAKAIGLPHSRSTDEEFSRVVDSKQKALSQITELLFAAHVLHRSVVNVVDTSSTLHQGNKLATLIGDLLMAKTSRRLSDLKNHTVTELMSNTICEFSASGFIGEGETPIVSSQTSDNSISSRRKPINEVPLRMVGMPPELTYHNWLERSRQGLGSIVGNSCVSCMILAGQEESTKRFISEFGRNLGVLLQAYRDLTIFDSEDGSLSEHNTSQHIDLWTLPVIFEVEQNPTLIPQDINHIHYSKVFEAVQSSQLAILNSKRVVSNFQSKVINLVKQLEPSDSTSHLLEILSSMNPKTSQ